MSLEFKKGKCELCDYEGWVVDAGVWRCSNCFITYLIAMHGAPEEFLKEVHDCLLDRFIDG